MKVNKVTITKKEKEDIEKYLDTDPCECFDCGGMSCDSCPFRKIVEELENVRCNFRRMILEEVSVEETKDEDVS
jgi:hypothetical protein